MNRRKVLKGVAGAALVLPTVITAEAETPEMHVLEAYNHWLFRERLLLVEEMYPNHPDAWKFVPMGTGLDGYHSDAEPSLLVSRRAPIMLRAAGVSIGDIKPII